MTQFIGWTTTHKPLNLKDWPLYMTQYIWSYSSTAQSKLLPATVDVKNKKIILIDAAYEKLCNWLEHKTFNLLLINNRSKEWSIKQ